jgi:hypothetical protein
MLFTLDVLQKRRDSLATTLISLEENMKDIRERAKIVRKEIANTTGAIIEIDRMIESHD